MSEQSTTEQTSETGPTEAVATRRSLVTKGAIAAAVGAAAGLALNDSASAADGAALLIGTPNSGVATTTLFSVGGLEVIGGAPGNNGGALIYGYTEGGTSASYGVRGRGGTKSADGGPEVSSIGVFGDANGNDTPGVRGYNSSSGGGPGVEGEADQGAGVYGQGNGTSGYGVHGKAMEAQGLGVYGESVGSDCVGVYGEHKGEGTRSGSGVRGVTDGGAGVVGEGTSADLRASGSGKVVLGVAASPDPAPVGPGSIGTIARGADGTLWYCYDANAWRKIAGGETGGAFHPVAPFRVYDSRKETDGKFTGGENRTISVADSKDVDTYAVVTANAVPAGATAVVGNVVAIGTTDTGFMSVNPGGTTAITAATVNWAAGQNIGNAGTFTLNGSRELEAVFGPGAGANLTMDITGYYL